MYFYGKKKFDLAFFSTDERKKNNPKFCNEKEEKGWKKKNCICEQIWLESKENTFTCKESIKKREEFLSLKS